MALHDDLRAAIDKNLSAETAGVLRARLDSIDGLEKRVAELVKDRDAAIKDCAEANGTVKVLTEQKAELEKQVAAFKVREDILAGAERSILIATMQQQQADNLSVVGMVFAKRHAQAVDHDERDGAGIPPADRSRQLRRCPDEQSHGTEDDHRGRVRKEGWRYSVGSRRRNGYGGGNEGVSQRSSGQGQIPPARSRPSGR